MAMLDGNRDLLRKMVEVLEPTVENGLADLKAAIGTADVASLASLAHRLKGALGNVAADEAVAAAKALEQLGNAGDLRGAEGPLATLQDTACPALAELRELASPNASSVRVWATAY